MSSTKKAENAAILGASVILGGAAPLPARLLRPSSARPLIKSGASSMATITATGLIAAAEKLEAAARGASGEIGRQFSDRAEQLRSNAFNLGQYEAEPGGAPAEVIERYAESAKQFLAMIGRRGDH